MTLRPFLLFGIVFSLLLSACATWQRHGIMLRAPQKLQIAVLPVRDNVHITKLKQLETIPKGTKPLSNEKMIAEEKMKQITAQITKDLTNQFQKTYFFETVPYEKVERALKELGNPGSQRPLTKEEAKEIGKKLHVPALLTVRLDSYGKVRPSWITFFLLTAVVEASAQGVIAAEAIGNTWVALGLATEEIAQETVEWVGGAMLFNKLFTPVIMEAKLWSTVDGGEMWHKTVIATPHRNALKKLSKTEKKKRESRLRLSDEQAQESIIKSLEKNAARNAY